MDAFARDWPAQRERWQRLEAWEDRQLRLLPADYVAGLAWMSSAWELACRHDPAWGRPEAAREHWEHLAEIRRRLARARLCP